MARFLRIGQRPDRAIWWIWWVPTILELLYTVPLLNSPWSSPKKFSFRKFWRSYLDQNLLRITNPQIRSQIWPGTSSSMWFFEVAILEITIRFFKFVWEILPIQPTIQTRKKISTPPFSRRWELFSKIGLRGCTSTAISGATTEADFWKMFSSSRKRGGADAF